MLRRPFIPAGGRGGNKNRNTSCHGGRMGACQDRGRGKVEEVGSQVRLEGVGAWAVSWGGLRLVTEII